MSTTLEFAGTTRCEIRATEVSQLSRGAAWLLVTLDQGTNKKSKIWGGIVCAPAACEFLTDFPNRVNMWKSVTMLWVLEYTVVNRCFDQARLVSCSVIKLPVVCSSNGDITFIVNKRSSGQEPAAVCMLQEACSTTQDKKQTMHWLYGNVPINRWQIRYCPLGPYGTANQMQLGLVQWNGIGAAVNTTGPQGEAIAAMGCQPGYDNSAELCQGERYASVGIEHSRPSIWHGRHRR